MCFKIRQTQREASVPHSPDGLTPAIIFCWFHQGNHRAFFSFPIPLHLWKNSCRLTRCPQTSASCKAVGHSVHGCQPLVTKGSAGAGQDVSIGMAVCVCTDVPVQGMILHSLMLEGCNSLELASPTSHTDTRVKFIILFAALFQDN